MLGIIELGRRLITTLIKGLGALLKKLVSVVFAKFPGIAAKICSKIDSVVNKAVQAVNQLAQKLKTKVTQVMDFLAAKVDQALAAVQNFYSKLISTLGSLLIATFLDVMSRIGALGQAAKRSFSHLEGKMWEYLLGVDISKPMGGGAVEGGEVEQAEGAGAGAAANEKLSAEDIEMESVEQGEMDPALVQEANLKDGETKEMPGSRDPATMDSIMAEFDTGAAKQSLGGKIADGAKLRANNAKMLFDQIKSYVIKWMKAHGLQIIAGIAGVLVVAGVAFVATGGAVTVLIPPILNIITVVMQAQAIVSVAQSLAQAAGYIGTYLSQGWQKMIEPAAIALAAALAMGLVELAMAVGFKAIGAGVKKAGQAVKKGAGAAASGVKNAVGAGAKGIKSLLKSGAKLASKSGSMIIRNGKIVIKSLQKGLMKGAKKLRGLLDRILQKFKFKKFKLERKGKHIRLYGEVNPWVLLADGTIQEVDSLDGRKAGISTQAELDKIKSLKPSERIDIYNRAVAKPDGKIDFDSIKLPDTDVPPAFKQTEFASSYQDRLHQTPGKKNVKVSFEATRGESLATLKQPADPKLKQILDDAGVKGIEYKNSVPDFSPVAKAQVEVDHMLGGVGGMGKKARRINFAQADLKLVDQLNASPELARRFGMKAGSIKRSDVAKYRNRNGLTWHELNDVKTLQLVPTEINDTFGHLGGVGEINAGAFEFGGFANK
ncbi:HNH endonuclease [Paenibacillus sp. FSL K6-1096]|uniref:HNH endonuclease n=1 Tax=Paenibacillus sp. FSL K6-1096 TaxID=2921460 RepID=UPI0030EF9FB4